MVLKKNLNKIFYTRKGNKITKGEINLAKR